LQQLRCGQHVDVLSLSGSCEEMEEIQHWSQRNQREPLHGLTLAEMQGTSETPWVQAPRSAIRGVLTFVDFFL
jgi:predicted ATPase with chaperone activity